MSDSTLAHLKKVCKYHRSKQYYVASLAGRTYLPDDSAGLDCWCLLTQGPVGPDDKFVSTAGCCSGRTCFESQLAG